MLHKGCPDLCRWVSLSYALQSSYVRVSKLTDTMLPHSVFVRDHFLVGGLRVILDTATDTPLSIFSVSLGLEKDRSDPNRVISPVQGLTSQGRTHACRPPGRAL